MTKPPSTYRFTILDPHYQFGHPPGQLPPRGLEPKTREDVYCAVPKGAAGIAFFSIGRRAIHMLSNALHGANAPPKNYLDNLSYETCAALVGQIVHAVEKVEVTGVSDAGKSTLVRIDSALSKRETNAGDLDSRIPSEYYYAAYALHWLDQASMHFMKKRLKKGGDCVSLGGELVARAESVHAGADAHAFTQQDLTKIDDAAQIKRKRKVAAGGGKQRGQKYKDADIPGIILRVYKAHPYGKLSVSNVVKKIKEEVQGACAEEIQFKNRKSTRPYPGKSAIRDAINEYRTQHGRHIYTRRK